MCERYRINPITQPDKITYKLVRDFLKTTGYSHFYENIVQIISKLTKQPPRRFTAEQKEQLTHIFNEIQEPFQRHKGKRKNFLSYSYVTYKSCELLGLHHMLPLLPLLKIPQNLLDSDGIWKKICEDCQYEFIKTI